MERFREQGSFLRPSNIWKQADKPCMQIAKSSPVFAARQTSHLFASFRTGVRDALINGFENFTVASAGLFSADKEFKAPCPRC